MKPNNYQGVLSNIREAEAQSAELNKYAVQDLALCMKRAKMKYDASKALQPESFYDETGETALQRIILLEAAVRELYIFLEVNLREELEALDVPEL